MDTDKEKKGSCCSCEADFKKEVNELVENAQEPTSSEHTEKEEELKEAFKKENKE